MKKPNFVSCSECRYTDKDLMMMMIFQLIIDVTTYDELMIMMIKISFIAYDKMTMIILMN